MSLILYESDTEKEQAIATKARQEEKKNSKLYTEIKPLTKFYLAEAYHHKYYLQLVPELKGDLRRTYPEVEDFINSTAAARINGYVKGLGTMDELIVEIGDFNLSEQSNKRLLNIVEGFGR